jgi:hypothetical protein
MRSENLNLAFLSVTVSASILCASLKVLAQTEAGQNQPAQTPRVYHRQSAIPGTPAPPLPTPVPGAISNAQRLNAPVVPRRHLVSTLKREIQLTDFGAKATWGRTKVFFPSTLQNRVSVVTPDGRHLSFRPTYIVLENRATEEAVLLGTVTNRDVGTIYPTANSVVWSNIFDSGPKVSLELIYDGLKGKVEQNVLLQENLDSLPSGWSASDVALECWTAWWQDSGPSPTVQSRTVSLRPAVDTNSPVAANDSTISFGAARITAGGTAFSLDSDAQPLPVAKSWIIPDSQGADQPTGYLIEAVDLTSALPQIEALPKAVRQSSLEPKKRSRSELARFQPPAVHRSANNTKAANRRMLVAQAQPSPSTRDTSRSSLNPLRLLPQTSVASRPAFCLDFTLTEAVALPANAISWWPAGSNAADALANHNDGTEYNGVTYTAGEVGQGFNLDGNGAHAHVGDSASLHVTNALTIEAWINPSSYGPDDGDPWFQNMVDKWDITGAPRKSYGFSLAPDSTAYLVLSSNGDDSGASFVVTSNAVPFDEWTHIAGVYDGTAIRMYFNGSPDRAGSYTAGIFPGTNDLGIGGSVGGGTPGDVDSPFRGVLDEPTVYAGALSTTEIQAIYNAGPAGKFNPSCIQSPSNAVAWWPGDGNAFDIAHTNMGTMRNDATFAPGIVGQAFSLNDQYVQVPNNFDLNPTDQLTIEAWVYMQHVNDSESFVCKGDGYMTNQYMLAAAHRESDDKGELPQLFRAYMDIDGGDYDGLNFLEGTTEVQPQTWYHVAQVYDGTNLSIYVNGVLDASAPLSGSIATSSQPISIGGGIFGLIDEPTIYNRALSDTEIAEIYSAGCAGKCKNWQAGDLLTDLQYQFLGLSGSDDDGDGVSSGLELLQGRNPHVVGTASNTNNLINLHVYTPLK